MPAPWSYIARCKFCSAVLDVIEGKLVQILALGGADRANQADALLVGQREDGKEIGLVQFHIQVAIELAGPSLWNRKAFVARLVPSP
jgi:hypothetical protein